MGFALNFSGEESVNVLAEANEMTDKKKALVIGCHVSGLAVIRTLGEKGIPVVAMVYDQADFGDVSRYVSERVAIPHPRLEEGRFVRFLLENAHRWEGALIIDTDDNGAVASAKHKKELSEHYQIATAEWDLLKIFIEKHRAHQLCQECGVPHPKNFLPKSMNDLESIKKEISYPCILKPVRGHEFFSKFQVKNFEAENESELTSRFELCLDAEQEVMIQEIIPGKETNLYKMQAYINSKGKLSAKFFWNKIRQHPPMFGVGRVGISRGIDETEETFSQVERMAETLMSHIGYKGYFSIEFKKDLRDNQLKLMEVNVRMPRNGMLAIASGVDFPWVIYKDLVEDIQIETGDYKNNFYWIEIYIDIYNALFHRKKENFTLKEYVAPYLSRSKAFAVFSRNDPKPFLKQTWHYALEPWRKYRQSQRGRRQVSPVPEK